MHRIELFIYLYGTFQAKSSKQKTGIYSFRVLKHFGSSWLNSYDRLIIIQHLLNLRFKIRLGYFFINKRHFISVTHCLEFNSRISSKIRKTFYLKIKG